MSTVSILLLRKTTFEEVYSLVDAASQWQSGFEPWSGARSCPGNLPTYRLTWGASVWMPLLPESTLPRQVAQFQADVSWLQGIFLNWAEYASLWLCTKAMDSASFRPSPATLVSHKPNSSPFLTATFTDLKPLTDHPDTSLLPFFSLFSTWQGLQTLPISILLQDTLQFDNKTLEDLNPDF